MLQYARLGKTFDQIYFAIEKSQLYIRQIIQIYVKYKMCFLFLLILKMSNIKRCYNAAAMFVTALVDFWNVAVWSFATNVAATLLQRLTKYISCGNVDYKSSQS